MPHAVIEGELDAERVHRQLEPFTERSAGCVLRVTDTYLARSGHRVLLDAVVVEGTTRHFLVEVSGHPGGVTVRLFPLTDPDKTDGVRRLLATVAGRIRGLDHRARITRTNLTPLLETT